MRCQGPVGAGVPAGFFRVSERLSVRQSVQFRGKGFRRRVNRFA
jgi:hypothetical protein